MLSASSTNHLSSLFQQDIDLFRQQYFTQWVFVGPMGYCQSPSGWSFFGFLQRELDILCIAATDHGDFYTSRVSHHFLEQALSQRMKLLNRQISEPTLMSLLDLAAADPNFFFTLPYRPIPAGLDLWDEEGAFILLAQIAMPLQRDKSERDLTMALYQWMDSEILIFLSDSFLHPTLGDYCFIHAATDIDMRAQRMRTLLHNPGDFPRTYHRGCVNL
ncbi:hypothetical protein JKG47_07165 [Acidithiobacillus sp. MC6.1]|nr:hypothetical protein [Acidithiobacillus sp. MC6.1]